MNTKVYFQNYGYTNHLTGKQVNKHIGWVTKSFNKSLPKAEKEIVEAVQAEIKKIIG